MGYSSTFPPQPYGATDNVLQDDATLYTKNGTTYQLAKTFYQIENMSVNSYLRFKSDLSCEAGPGVNNGYMQVRYYDLTTESVLFTNSGPEGVWTPTDDDFTANWRDGGELRIYIKSEQALKDVYIKNEELCGELSPFIQ